MSHTIWKYKLQAVSRQEIEMPWGSQIKKLAVIGGAPCLWVLVDVESAAKDIKSVREIRLYATGEEITDASQLEYIGSIAADNAAGKTEVIHCFEALRIIV